MAKRKKDNKQGFLTENQRDALASSLVILSTFAIFFNFTALASKAYFDLFIFDSTYALMLWGFILLLTNRVQSEVFRRAMTLLGIAGAITSILLMYAMFTFHM